MNLRGNPEVSMPRHGSTQATRGPDCWQCKFFGITHIPATPYSCQLMGFRSRTLPALQVLQVDGHFCLGFTAKEQITRNRPVA